MRYGIRGVYAAASLKDAAGKGGADALEGNPRCLRRGLIEGPTTQSRREPPDRESAVFTPRPH